MVRPLLTIDGLSVSFDAGPGPRVQAVDGVGLTLFPRQTLAVVGESGCGKSVTAMSILGLNPSPPARNDAGSILYKPAHGDPVDIASASPDTLRRIRGGEIAMIFQEPMSSLNPVTTIGDQLVEAIRLHRTEGGAPVSVGRARSLAVEALGEVGIPQPAQRLRAYPHQFSGGMRQRVMIAMALACEPRVLIADEPTTALDVTVQRQILELIAGLVRDRGLGVLLITHDLGVVAENADVVCVMYSGRVVEYARVSDLFARPSHPYTRGLLACIPRLDESQRVGDPLPAVADVIDADGAFSAKAMGMQDAGESIIPWWPWHTPPAGVEGPTGAATNDSVLIEARPEHWVRCWRTPDAAARASASPCVLAPPEPAGAEPAGVSS